MLIFRPLDRGRSSGPPAFTGRERPAVDPWHPCCGANRVGTHPSYHGAAQGARFARSALVKNPLMR